MNLCYKQKILKDSGYEPIRAEKGDNNRASLKVKQSHQQSYVKTYKRRNILVLLLLYSHTNNKWNIILFLLSIERQFAKHCDIRNIYFIQFQIWIKVIFLNQFIIEPYSAETGWNLSNVHENIKYSIYIEGWFLKHYEDQSCVWHYLFNSKHIDI